MSGADRHPRVVYIAGAGRSGSTILTRMLGSAPGVVAAGEVVHLWDRGVSNNERCACGVAFHDCPRWTDVGRLAFGGWETPSAERMADLRHMIDRQRHLPRIMFPGLGGRTARAGLRSYVDGLTALYRAVATAGDGHTVVDSSKHGSTAHVLRHARGIDLQIVLLVRHPAAVSHSWTKHMVRPEVPGGRTHMPTYAPAASAGEWLSRTLEAQAVALFGAPVHVVRYEDLMADPQRTVPRLCDQLGLPDAPTIRDRSIDLRLNHTVAGHPNRFRTGVHELRADDDWRRRMAPHDVRQVAALTGPVARAYGYRFGERSAP